MSNCDGDADDLDFSPHFWAATGSCASDPGRMEAAYRLRFDVYCNDCRFLDAAAYPDGRERDEYDDDAMHFFAFNLGDELVGYVRLVRNDLERRFPWQLHCRDVLPDVVLPDARLSAEVSRLMVRRDYRRRKGDTLAGVDTSASNAPADDGAERRTRSPQIMLSLYRQMYQSSRSVGTRYWYAAMERSLARTLEFMGFPFRRIAEEADYYGPVAPYLADLHELESVLRTRNPELLEWMQAPPGRVRSPGAIA